MNSASALPEDSISELSNRESRSSSGHSRQDSAPSNASSSSSGSNLPRASNDSAALPSVNYFEEAIVQVFSAVWNVLVSGVTIFSTLVYAVFGTSIDKGLNSRYGVFMKDKFERLKSFANSHNNELQSVGDYAKRFTARIILFAIACCRFAFYTAKSLGTRLYSYLMERSSGMYC